MPTSLNIAFFVFGAILVSAALFGGNFKLFGAEVASTVSSNYIRVLSFFIGGFFIWLVLFPLKPDVTPFDQNIPSQPHTQSGPADTLTSKVSVLPMHSGNFPKGGPSPSDNRTIPGSSKVAPSMGASNNTVVLIKPDDRISYTWWKLGEGLKDFSEIDGNSRSNATPAVALVGDMDDYLFVVVKTIDNLLYLNQGQLGKTFVGWNSMNFQTNISPGSTSSANTTAIIAVGPAGRIFYTWWGLGEGAKAFSELDGGGHTDTTPAVTLVGNGHNYLFSIIKGIDDYLYLNQGNLGNRMVGWQRMNFQTGVAPSASCSGNISVVAATSKDGQIFYSWWELGKGGSEFIELMSEMRTDVSPAVALVGGEHNYLFVVIKGIDGNLYLNQGELGKPFVGWRKLV
jgi:hypothetical protein